MEAQDGEIQKGLSHRFDLQSIELQSRREFTGDSVEEIQSAFFIRLLTFLLGKSYYWKAHNVLLVTEIIALVSWCFMLEMSPETR